MNNSTATHDNQPLDEFIKKNTFSHMGYVRRVTGNTIEGSMLNARVGDLCNIVNGHGGNILAEVVGFSNQTAHIAALDKVEGVSTEWRIIPLNETHSIQFYEGMVGGVYDGFGRMIHHDNPAMRTVPAEVDIVPVITNAPSPISRTRISEQFYTGVRAIDSCLCMGVGQRIGIFAGPGCGKTSLMAAMARGSDVDVIVIGLIGERGREINEFRLHDLEPELLARTVIVCATSDRTSLERVRAAFTATAIAEGYRNRNYKVLLLIDSLTRLARAQREIGLQAGEPPARGGFPPSVYSMLPRLIERSGNMDSQSITAVYTILSEGTTAGDPISEECMSLLDGHILLERTIAEKGIYPAIDILPSISRIMGNVADGIKFEAAGIIRNVLSSYKDIELIIKMGEYKKGLNDSMDRIVGFYPIVIDFIKQNTRKVCAKDDLTQQLHNLVSNYKNFKG